MHSTESESEESTPIGFNEASFRQKLQQRHVTVPKAAFDLTYDMLVDNGYKILNKLKEKDPENEIMKLNLEVKREGSNKTGINIIEISDSINRKVGHVTKFITSKTLTTGSINIEGKLLLRGNFAKLQIQDILRKYLEIYVVCKGCGKLETELQKDNRLWFVRCNKCGSSRTVANL